MAINKVEYDGNTLMDITDTTATAKDVANGKVFYGANGVRTLGTSQGGGGTATDVQINGTSITENNIANIITSTNYDSVNNPLATKSDVDKKQDKLCKISWSHVISSIMATQVDGYVKNALVDLSIGSLEQKDITAIINLCKSQKDVFLNSKQYVMDKMEAEDEEEEGSTIYALTYNIEMLEDEQEAEQYELGIERTDISKPCFFLILTPNDEMPNGYLFIIGSTETILNTTWNFLQEEEISYISDVAITGNYNDLNNIPTDIEKKNVYDLNNNKYFYQFYGVSSLDGITVNIGYDVDVVYATLVLIFQTIEELQNSYSPTLSAIQSIHIPDNVYQEPVLVINIHNIGCMTCYIDENSKYVTQAIFTNFEKGYSVNFGANPNELTIYYSALNSTNYLDKANTIPYNPTSDYNPATKKYVDDVFASIINGDEVSY